MSKITAEDVIWETVYQYTDAVLRIIRSSDFSSKLDDEITTLRDLRSKALRMSLDKFK